MPIYIRLHAEEHARNGLLAMLVFLQLLVFRQLDALSQSPKLKPR